MKRITTSELLDTDKGTPTEVASSLRDLDRINRWFGGIRATEHLVEHVARAIHQPSFSLLEVAAGSGCVLRTASARLRDRGLSLQVTSLDRVPAHMDRGGRAVGGDAVALPFRNDSFDVVSCNLFAHHLSPEELVCFVAEGVRVSRFAVLINDLVRHPLHLALVYAGMPLYRSRLTRYDAPASVRQAYTAEEMRTLLAGSTAARVEIHRHYLFRMGVIVWKS